MSHAAASTSDRRTVAACPPILMLAFNRPDTAAKVIDSLRAVRPSNVYFAVDGARPDCAGEAERVQEAQDLARKIDWPCEVKTLFRESNLGCKLAVSGAITWFFEHVDAGIVLEDDCIPHPSFFAFTAELLDKFRDDERVMTISGNNFQFGRRRTGYSYYFSRHTHIWGWASWRRAWQFYDHRMSVWPEVRDGRWLRDILRDRNAEAYWTRIFEETHAEKNSSWAYRWTFSSWVQGGLTILPAVNLVSNIGFSERATHTRSSSSPVANMPAVDLGFPLAHPPFVIRDDHADRFTEKTIFRSGSRVRQLLGAMRRRLRKT